MDIDVTVAMTPENLSALVKMARELGMRPVLPVELETLADLKQLDRWHRERNLEAFALKAPGTAGITLDVLLYPAMGFATLREHAVTFHAGEVPVVVASIDDLIALRQAAARPGGRRASQAFEGILIMPFDRGDRAYHVGDERLKAFRALAVEEKLRWQEELATFILLTREKTRKTSPSETLPACPGQSLDTGKISKSLRAETSDDPVSRENSSQARRGL